MDHLYETRRMKEYYQGLAQSAVVLPQQIVDEIRQDIEDPGTELSYRETMSFWAFVFLPFFNTLAYIVNNRFIHEEMPNILANLDPHSPTLPPQSIYQFLLRLNPMPAEEFVRTIQCTSSVHDQLLTALARRDEAQFCTILRENHCKLSVISHLCNHLWDNVSDALAIEENELPLMMEASLGATRSIDDVTINHMIPPMEQMIRSGERLEAEDTDQNFQLYIRDFNSYLCKYFTYLIFQYLDWQEYFSMQESALLSQILSRPEGQMQYQAALVQYQQQQSVLSQEQPSWPPPTDFLAFRCDADHCNEYLTISVEILSAGTDKLVQLIDYLAENDYISSSHEVKQLMTYRLTGKMRPPKVVPIEWHGHNNQPYELIYLVKHLSARANYRKMRQFFTGPKWVKDRDSSYAKSAHYDFRRFLHHLYPTSCPL